MWADLALSGLQSVAGFINKSNAAKSARQWQKYNNTMVALQGAQNQNTLTDNENMARERSQEEAFQIRRSEYVTKASVEVAAAATGTTGRSVNMMLFDVGRNAAVADGNRQRDLQLQYLGIDNQRRNVALQQKMSMDLTDIPDPSPFSFFADFVGSNMKDLAGGIKGISNKATPRITSATPDPWVQNGVNYRLGL